MKARIKLGAKATAGHREILESKGYEVAEIEDDKGKYLEIECSGFHEDPVDLTTEEGRETVKKVVADHGLFSYRTKFTIPNVEGQRYGIMACRRIGGLSAFIASPAEKPEKKSVVSEAMEALLDDIL